MMDPVFEAQELDHFLSPILGVGAADDPPNSPSRLPPVKTSEKGSFTTGSTRKHAKLQRSMSAPRTSQSEHGISVKDVAISDQGRISCKPAGSNVINLDDDDLDIRQTWESALSPDEQDLELGETWKSPHKQDEDFDVRHTWESARSPQKLLHLETSQIFHGANDENQWPTGDVLNSKIPSVSVEKSRGIEGSKRPAIGNGDSGKGTLRRESSSQRQGLRTQMGSAVLGKRSLETESSSGHEQAFSIRARELSYRIPGPAGNLQNAGSRKPNGKSLAAREQRSTPHRSSQIDTEVSDDIDFLEGPWLTAVESLRSAGYNSKSTISAANNFKRQEHFPQLVAIIKAVSPNGFGDASVVLKDPTGTISGIIHRTVLAQTEFAQHVAPGAVICLQKVAIFSPNHWTHYLNITTKNVIQIFGNKACYTSNVPRYPTRFSLHPGTADRDETCFSNSSAQQLADSLLTKAIPSRRNSNAKSLEPISEHEPMSLDSSHTCTEHPLASRVDGIGERPPATSSGSPLLSQRDRDVSKIPMEDTNCAPSHAPKAADSAIAMAKAAGWDDVEKLLDDILFQFG